MSKLGAPMSLPGPRLGLVFVLLSSLSFVAFVYNINRPQHPTVSSSTSFFANRISRASAVAELCPHSTVDEHIPTIILRADGTRGPRENRTFFVPDASGQFPALLAPRTEQKLRFDQGVGEMAYGADATGGAQLCEAHDVPSSPPAAVPNDWSNNEIMFGMSTKAERVMFNLPVWEHWMPRSEHPIDGSVASTRDLPLLVILTPPPENAANRTKLKQAQDDGLSRGIHLDVRPREADRFETRYFALAQEMWRAAERREKLEGVRTEWFVFADDDTFFPDWDLLVRMLGKYDPDSPLLIGALSEAISSLYVCGVMAYGGAGIYVSRAMMAAMNAPGILEDCLDEFGELFGGDNMVSRCAAYATGQDVSDLTDTLVIEDSLHQLDVMGDASGWFQSGFHITSMHHWGTWFHLYPDWHAKLISSNDVRSGILLAGKAARAVGGDNWLRRYVFDGGRSIVTLGYSVTIYTRPLSYAQLAQSEHTWYQFPSFWPMRAGISEGFEKKTYYITQVRRVGGGVWKLEHRNREGERIDIVWDARGGGEVAKWSEKAGW